jgi:predicted O-methyltransferase YrrM
MARHTFTKDWFSSRVPLFEKYLVHLCDKKCRALEIGSLEGRATVWLLEHVLNHPESSIDTIDVHLQENFWTNIAASGGENKVRFHLGKSRDILRRLPINVFDFVYVDGCHWTVDVLEDAVLSFRLAKIGAVIAFDDYKLNDPRWTQHGTPKKALDVFMDIYEEKIEVVSKGWQIWLRKISD